MPGLKQLEQFRKELSDLGNEREITAGWGEVYEELPLPEAIAPTTPPLDVDNLLASLGDESADRERPSFDADSSRIPDFDDLLASLPLGSAETPESRPQTPTSRPESRAPRSQAPRSRAPEPVEEPSFIPEPVEESPVADELGADSFALPDDLLSGFASDIEDARSAGPDLSFEMPDFGEELSAAPVSEAPETFEIPEMQEVPEIPEVQPEPVEEAMPVSVEPLPEFDIPEAFTVPDIDFGAADVESSIPEIAGLEPPDVNLADVNVADVEPTGLDASTESADSGLADLEATDLEVAELEPSDLEPSDLEAAEIESLDLTPSDIEFAGEPPAAVDAVEGLEALLSKGLPDLGEPEAEFPVSLDAAEEEIPAAEFAIPELDEMDFTPSFETPPSGGADEATEIPDSFLPSSFDAAPSGPSATDKFGEDFADFSIPSDLSIPDSSEPSAMEPVTPDGFDGFSLDEDILKTSIDSSGGEDDFHIPGFSDFTSAPARSALSEFPAGGGAKKSAPKQVPLEISDENFSKFISELSSFPLNLRMAAEEFISGDTGTELQKMGLVHDVINKTPIRKIAKQLENYLSRLIPIPKDFEKKTMEEYEQEKASLRYVLVNKIAPAAVLFTIIAVLSACTIFLSYQFIYRPLAAESLYQRGYAAIEDTRYSQALSLFDTAVSIWDKKPWYFKYARAFRDQKQYISAEAMYERILVHFHNDKQGGLEYAEMLRTDLRNFEKAETVLKRRLLDNYVNDPDALLLLGDTYLDWAEEDPSKYEEARKSYSTLINLYGSADLYLSRMMRYFVRTDNLKEVLPLKEHFMSKKAKIGAQDLGELSGYLLQKRYESAPGDNEYLRSKIEDVRTLLERAVKADRTSPEAHYNIGRFFIYNYKAESAKESIAEAIRQFDEAQSMSPKRVLARIDAYRLMGELNADDKEFLKARDLYAQGITLYEEQRLNRSVRQNPLVGKLYADIADIDYFISGDLDGALMNYSKSVEELNDTPSTRYRIGYINFQKQDYESAIKDFLRSSIALPNDRNIQYAFGNTLFRRGDYFAAQGYYERLMESLDAERLRKGIILPQIRVDHAAFVESYMRATNNLAVTLERISVRTGDSQKRARAIELLSESNRAWDGLTRNPETMIRASGSNLAFLNIQNMTQPRSTFVPEIYQDIPRTLENEKILQQETDQ